MGGFVLLVIIVAGLVWAIRLWRQRELARFRESDIRTLHELTGGALPGATQQPETTPERGAESALEVSAQSPLEVVAAGAAGVEQPGGETPARAVLKPAALDEIHRRALQNLEQLLDDGYRVFVNKPLADFMRLDNGAVEPYGRQVSLLICERTSFAPVCGVHLRGAGQQEVSRFRDLGQRFEAAGLPLASVPLTPDLSAAEIREQLASVMPSVLRQPDPE